MNFKMEHVQIPANNIDESIQFYQELGFKVTNKTNWGWAEMVRSENEKIALIDAKFFKNICLGFATEDIKALKKSLEASNCKIIDDSTDVVDSPHLSFVDPSGNEIVVSSC